MFRDPMIQRVADAVGEVGIRSWPGEVQDDSTLLFGFRIEGGGIVVDETKAPYPGDLLHEAGHLAVMSPEDRERVAGTLPVDGGQEMAVLAWSYAMAIRFDLPLDVVFHDAFKGDGPWLRDTFRSGQTLGVPLLQCWEMTRMDGCPQEFEHLPVFPEMAKWLRDG